MLQIVLKLKSGRSGQEFELKVYLELFPLTDMDIFGDYLDHFFLGIFVFLDDLFQEFVEATDGLIIFLDRVAHDEDITG